MLTREEMEEVFVSCLLKRDDPDGYLIIMEFLERDEEFQKLKKIINNPAR
jgi:hypothetical protein